MKQFLSFLFLIAFGCQMSFGQRAIHAQTAPNAPKLRCGTMENDARLRAEHPEMGTLADFEVWMEQKMQERAMNKTLQTNTIYTIPVIVHLIHNGEAVGTGSNISQAQINSQITVLNQDYRRTNADAANTPSVFAAVAADCEIEFCLALTDPQGNTLLEPGIERISRSSKGFSAPPYGNTTYIDNTIKTATSWDPTKYMNIWVLDLGGGLLGYAQFPSNTGLGGLNTNGGAANKDGVVIGYKYFGSSAIVNTTQLQQGAPYDLGRTATHEVGHWLGLRHINGDANCSTDYVADTPTQSSLNYGCPAFPHVSCSNGPNGDMFMNYMDYVDDNCMNTFTAGQKARMVTVMTMGTPRSALNNSTVCNSTTAAPVANFNANATTVCLGNSIQFTSTSTGNPTSYSWTFQGGTPATSTVQNPTISYAAAGTYNVSLTVSNANGSNTKTTNAYITVTNSPGASLPLVQGFEGATFVPTGWSLGVPSPDTFEWRRTTTVSGFGASTACARFDNFSGDNNSNPDGTRDELVTPKFSLAGVTTAQVTFDVAYAYVIISNVSYADTLIAQISTDCGTTWTQIYKKQGGTLQTAPPRTSPTTAFVPTATQWRTETVSLNSYIGQNSVMIRFINGSNWGDYLYLDNVNITSTTAQTVQAAFTATPQTLCTGNTVTYTSTSTGNPTSYSWTFAGGTPATSTTQNPTVTYNTAGTYNASLTVSNGTSNNTASQSNFITVNAAPTAAYVPNVTANSLTVAFTNNSVGGTTYSWNFGDGSTSTQMSPTHTYANSGTYIVYLSVTNNCGTVSFQQEVTVSFVGIDDAFMGNVHIYPNPTEGNFTFEMNDADALSANLVLYNVHGQEIFHRSVQLLGGSVKENIQANELASGTYFLQVSANNKVARYKLLVINK